MVVCDMRRLNAVTELPAFPIPKISDVLEGLKGSTMFSTLDMNMAYYQVKLITCTSYTKSLNERKD